MRLVAAFMAFALLASPALAARGGDGQDDEWVMANFTNATEILAVGYPQWVDAQVGEGLTNGLYKFTATVPDDPPETIQLVVGDYSVAVTNAGEYVFLLEKGVDYEYGTVPFMASATYSAVDDVPQTRGGTPLPDPEGQTPTWSVDGGRYNIAPQTESALGRVLWLPLFFGSPNVGSGSFTAMFALPSGETRGVGKTYRAIEPIRKLVCNEIDPLFPCVFNPSRLVYGHPARLKVDARGNFTPDDVLWRVVSGPGTVARGEDGFGTPDWTATVTATASSGEVVVEARFNEDAIQPRFVLPIVQMRRIPIAAYVVCDSNNVGATTQTAIEEKLLFANEVWRQAGIEFYLSGDAVELQHPQLYDIAQVEVRTNVNGKSEIWPSVDVYALMSLVPPEGCVRTFWVNSITNGTPLAFTLRDSQSVFLSSGVNMRALAHELGHVVGLKDIYDYRPIGVMAGINDPAYKECFDDKVHDWGQESQRGFYPSSITHGDLIRSMLMYGYDSQAGLDLPSGKLRGLHKKSSSLVNKDFLPVGANDVASQQ